MSRQQYDFLENYQMEHHYKTRSAVIKEALDLLQGCYREANEEIDEAFEATAADGIEED